MSEQTAQEPPPGAATHPDGNGVAPVDGAPPSTCPNCGAAVSPSDAFCETCGQALTRTSAPPAPGRAETEAPIEITRSFQAPPALEPEDDEDTIPVTRPCPNCGGPVGADGYCQICGMKAPSERDHYTEQPASWVAACCDRGIRHHRNEDATAIAADPQPGSRAVLVVCDGVSTSIDSDVASLAGARAARDLLADSRPAGLGTPASTAAAMAQALEQAAAAANAAVIANTAPDSTNAAACTLSAAVLDGHTLYFGNVGDSRVYWIPDPGTSDQPIQLSVDDSVASARIAMGVSREEAENGPGAHAITKWLGRDSPDFSPMTASLRVATPGWLLVCSDGLWNYASEADALQALIADLSRTDAGPLPLAERLVAWANEQGGKDNIGVALARHEP
jgi:serine/threonine protein phosphatase PrpC